MPPNRKWKNQSCSLYYQKTSGWQEGRGAIRESGRPSEQGTTVQPVPDFTAWFCSIMLTYVCPFSKKQQQKKHSDLPAYVGQLTTNHMTSGSDILLDFVTN